MAGLWLCCRSSRCWPPRLGVFMAFWSDHPGLTICLPSISASCGLFLVSDNL